VADEVHRRLGMELLMKNVGTFRTDILTIRYVSYVQIGHVWPD